MQIKVSEYFVLYYYKLKHEIKLIDANKFVTFKLSK